MRAAVLMLALATAGCTTQPVATVAPICGSMRTVYISKDDTLTEKTASSIERNNLAPAKLCGASRPPPREKGAPTS